jgi:hypothetical protein
VAKLNPHELVVVYDKDKRRISLSNGAVHEVARRLEGFEVGRLKGLNV